MSKAWTKQQAQENLNLYTKDYKLIEWGGGVRNYCTLQDKNGNLYKRRFDSFRNRLKKNKNLKLRKHAFHSKETAQKKLDQLSNNRIQIITWGGNVRNVSTFKDVIANEIFKQTFDYVSYSLKKNPQQIFNGNTKNLNFEDARNNIFSLSNDRIELLSWGGNVRSNSYFYDRENKIYFSMKYEAVRAALSSCGEHVFGSRVYTIEKIIQNFLNEINVDFKSDKYLSNKYRYDILIPSHNLIIECDGLYWHSDGAIYNPKDKNYHINKKEFYKEKKYDSLFFREDEIKNQLSIVKSILKNRLGLSDKVYARKTKIKTIDRPSLKRFLTNNHLMGFGQGDNLSLVFEENTVSCLQWKWKNKQAKIIEISRFCNKINTTVVGGFSKLLKELKKQKSPNKIISFVDKRYGSGNYLENLGFNKVSENPSFMWTNGKETFHRMKFPNNTGYDNDLLKIWDCGQAKYEWKKDEN